MDATIMEFLKVILPSLFTGVISFLVARYTSNKNMPLDKLEITYNQVYFPIYRLISEGKSLNEIKEKSEKYISDNFKYVNETTWKAFRYLNDASETEKQKAFTNFKNNVKKMNSKLRRKLGYLEVDLFAQYNYSSSFEKKLYRLSGEIIIIYLFLILVVVTHVLFKELNLFLGCIMLVSIVVFVLELFGLLVRLAVNRIKELTKKKNRKNALWIHLI